MPSIAGEIPEPVAAAEAIAFAELRPGDKVADFLPATAYFANIFCKAVGESGHVYVISPPATNDAGTNSKAVTSPGADCTNVTTEILRSRNYPAPELHSDSDDPGWVYEYWASRLPVESFVAAEPLDVIWIAGRYHALHGKESGSPNIQFVGVAWLAALKPGGILVIADQAARIEPDQVRREMIAAGFQPVGESRNAGQFLLRFRKP